MQGYQVDPGLPVPENTTAVEISANRASWMAYVENDPVPVELGPSSIADLINEPSACSVGNNLLLATDASGEDRP
jgi:flagellar basal-body rod protein FlgG